MFRILHLGKYFPPFAGGIENFLADLMFAQVEQGDIVSAIVHDHQPQFSRFLAPVQAEMWHHQMVYRTPSYGRLLYAPVSPHFPFWFNRVLQIFQPQLLHLHLPNTSAFFALWLTRAKQIPWVIHWHSDVVSELNQALSIAYKFYRPFEYQLLANAHTIIATSPPYLASSTALQPWREKCQVIPLGIAQSRLPTSAPQAKHWAEQQWIKGKIRILTVGRLTYYKGHEVLIRAMAQVHDAQLFIVGSGEVRQYLENLIVALNLSHKVRLLGYCKDAELTALFATCDVFCLASLERTEAFGVVFLEAMRYGKPIVATMIPGSGVSWVIKETGLLVPLQDSSALAKILQQMIDNPKLRIRLGKAGRLRFEQVFDIKKVAEKMSSLYKQVFNS
ncbi:MAG: glycosyl transferase family 1 [Gammaproteobacteria bacterium]|nr:MAG: glycosyl transferase family 1 [Gammaproteobacteria bacterium]RKZ44928.1 MAG: glycosyl transferase family 1 [Gammaproteobacteria bacterium]RKZ76541.1 MAG: glycosyl transferase family 1 [Gammaproteobacteria bacterium]